MMARIILGSIVAVLCLGIMIRLFSGVASDGLQGQGSELRDFADEVNRVCNDQQQEERGALDLIDYRITRSDTDFSQAVLLNARDEQDQTASLDCPVQNDFSISSSYTIRKSGSGVEVIDTFGGSTTGDPGA